MLSGRDAYAELPTLARVRRGADLEAMVARTADTRRELDEPIALAGGER